MKNPEVAFSLLKRLVWNNFGDFERKVRSAKGVTVNRLSGKYTTLKKTRMPDGTFVAKDGSFHNNALDPVELEPET